MTDHERLAKARREGFETGLSLARAIQYAGGSVPTVAELSEMTMMDFITKMAAQNAIRFHYDSRRPAPPKTPETDFVVVFGNDPKNPDDS